MNVKKKLEVVKKALEDDFHRKCYFCEFSTAPPPYDYPPQIVFCKLTGKKVNINDSCEKWQISSNLVKMIALKTNIFKS